MMGTQTMSKRLASWSRLTDSAQLLRSLARLPVHVLRSEHRDPAWLHTCITAVQLRALDGSLTHAAHLGPSHVSLAAALLTPYHRHLQGRAGRAVDLEDIKFHQCVRLTEFDENRQIVFTPPDGEFELMSYRLSQLELTPPFWVDCQVERHGSSRVEYMVKVRSQFKQKVQAQSVEVLVPCPPECQNPVTKQSAVRALPGLLLCY